MTKSHRWGEHSQSRHLYDLLTGSGKSVSSPSVEMAESAPTAPTELVGLMNTTNSPM